jgi:hypothetical protein
MMHCHYCDKPAIGNYPTGDLTAEWLCRDHAFEQGWFVVDRCYLGNRTPPDDYYGFPIKTLEEMSFSPIPANPNDHMTPEEMDELVNKTRSSREIGRRVNESIDALDKLAETTRKAYQATEEFVDAVGGVEPDALSPEQQKQADRLEDAIEDCLDKLYNPLRPKDVLEIDISESMDPEVWDYLRERFTGWHMALKNKTLYCRPK